MSKGRAIRDRGPDPGEARQGPRFAAVPHAFLDDYRSKQGHIAVYASLRSFADFGSENGAHPGTPRAAFRAGMSEPAFRRWRDELVTFGWIVYQASEGRAHQYVVHAILEEESDPERIDGGTPKESMGVPPPNARGSIRSTESQVTKSQVTDLTVASNEATGLPPVVQKWRSGKELTAGNLMSLLRHYGYADDGKPPTGYDDKRDFTIITKILNSGSSPESIAHGIFGAHLIRESDECRFLRPGEKFTMRIFWNVGYGSRSFFAQAIEASMRFSPKEKTHA